MNLLNVFLVTALWTAAAAGMFGTEENWISRLYKDKLANYDKNARPVTDPSHNTTIHLGLAVIHVDLDDHAQKMMVNAWVFMTWVDEYLRWIPKNYVNIERLHFDQDDVWVPDLKLFNSADGSDAHPFDEVPILADHEGRVYWFPPARLQVLCNMELTHWPRDTHTCEVRMGSWTHHGEQVDFQLLKENGTQVIMSNYHPNNRWELLEVTADREVTSLNDQDTFFNLSFMFTLKRQAQTHAVYITQSTLAVIVVVLASYLLPLHMYFLRMLLHLFALGVLIGCYFTLFTTLPSNGGPVPLIVRYYSGTIILTTISLLATLLLTTRTCCLTASASSNSGFTNKIVGFVSSAPGLRGVVGSENYNHLETEMAEDIEASTSTPQVNVSDDTGSSTTKTVRKVINLLLFVLFATAFVIDYVVLRSVT